MSTKQSVFALGRGSGGEGGTTAFLTVDLLNAILYA